ncbi:Protein of unknown function DUF295 [Macleaya cordata]|uniref:KIB1-4 beta-propeller domain-containing protein n=1 Tax=Macleaya cordata TaxID=56857 RepID=A0A200Q1X2_MACCD|nr:Protein of unknown function DUF295 [Macleaya cordata]
MEETLALALAASASEERSERSRPPGPRAAPWLVIPHGEGKKDQAFYNLSEPNIRTCQKFIPEMSGKSYWQKPSHQGWLVMLCDDDDYDYKADSIPPNCNFGDCFLWNPVTLETIQLPNLLDWLNKSDQYKILDCVLSSPPKSSNPDDDSMVFFLFERLDERDEQVLVFCRHGEDKQWRTKELTGYILNDGLRNYVVSLLCFKGKLYGMCLNFWHLEIEIQLGPKDDDVDGKTLSIRSFKVSNNTFFPLMGGEFFNVGVHYVESCDELFTIDIFYNRRSYSKIVISIQVLRLDFSLMAWEKVKSFGDHVLFLGKNTKSSCSAAELGLTRGCLYYTLPKDQSLYKFEVEDNGFTVILPCMTLPTPWFSADWMMMPTTVRLDFSKMVWVKVESLGKHMLFISNTSSLSAIAPDSRMENKIYFARLHGEEILFYSLDTGSYHCLGSRHSAKDFYDTTERLNCTWIEPNWLGTTEQELDWLSI